MCCPAQPVLALSGSEPLTPIGPDSAPSWGALACLTGAGPGGSETFAPPLPHHCPSSDTWGLFSGLVDGGRGHRSGEARPPSRENCEFLGSGLCSATSQGLLWMAETCDLLESPEPIAAPPITTSHLPRAGWGLLVGDGQFPARGAQTQAPVSLPAAPRSSRAAPAGDSRGTSVGSVSGSSGIAPGVRVGTESRRQVRRLDWGHPGPSRPQLCAKATPRAQRTRCACDPASAAAATATSGPTATPVSADPSGRGAVGAGPRGGGVWAGGGC